MIEARLTDELKLILYDTDKDKEIRSFPKKGTDPVKREAAEAKFKTMKQDIRNVVSSKRTELRRSFLSGEKYTPGQWKKDYFSNPVLMRIAQLLVWDQGQSYFTVWSGKAIHSDGTNYELTKEKIGLAHPIDMSEKQVAEWQKYFLDKGLKQFFAQVWEPVVFRNPNDIQLDRYDGCKITVGHILALEHQELVAYSYCDGLPNFEFAGRMLISGQMERAGHWFTENGPDNIITLGKITMIDVLEPRKLNRVLAYLDKRVVTDKIRLDEDEYVRKILHGQTLAQIIEYLTLAIDCKAEKCKAILLDYRNTHYSDYSNVEEFSLE